MHDNYSALPDSKPTMSELLALKYTSQDGQKQVIHIVDKIEAHWDRIGIFLGFDNDDINLYRTKYQPRDQCYATCMLGDWLEKRNVSSEAATKMVVTWRTLIQALKDVREHALASVIENALL